MSDPMTEDLDFDTALVTAALALAGEIGWSRVSVAEAARRAALPLDRARGRFASTQAILLRFGRMADQAALVGADSNPDASHRDRLFDILMRRLDVLQLHREGTLALMRAVPLDPGLGLMLAMSSVQSMGWMLEGAGVDATGLRGLLRSKGLLAVWLWTVRTWKDDDSEDMSATMSALDKALERAERAEGMMGRRGTTSVPDEEMEPTADESPAAVVESLPRNPPPPPDLPASSPA